MITYSREIPGDSGLRAVRPKWTRDRPRAFYFCPVDCPMSHCPMSHCPIVPCPKPSTIEASIVVLGF